MLKGIWNLTKQIYGFFVRLSEDRVGVYTAQASFFIMLAIFPFILLLLNIIGYTSIDKDTIILLINNYLPETVKPLFVQIINELFMQVSGTLISITAIAAVWSASKGVLSVMFGIYEIYKLHRNRNYFISRFISMAYTVAFVFILVITMLLLVFGDKIFHLLISLIPALAEISMLTYIVRYVVSFLMLVMIFMLILRVATFKRTTFKKVFPGAIISSIGWIVFSYIFSIYIDSFSDMTYIYGSLTAVIVLMLWLYFCIYIFFIGAEINKLMYPETIEDALSKDEDTENIQEIIEE